MNRKLDLYIKENLENLNFKRAKVCKENVKKTFFMNIVHLMKTVLISILMKIKVKINFKNYYLNL